MERHLLRRVALLLLVLSTALTSCDYITVSTAATPVPRQDDSTEGSARWAFELARERAVAEGFDPDNELYIIMGVNIGSDGRLPDNRGTWTFTFWNETSQKELEIELNYDGEIETQMHSLIRDAPTERPPLPAAWVDSTVIFQATPAFSTQFVDSAVTNLDEWPAEPGGAYWIIGCLLTQDCPHYYVSWDGEFLGDNWP